ncbi:MAG: homocysteine S-methyltransferase family protein [Clostridia bacterium]|nr:homocysteine S-methyltransferase family protein [Clostridia bacterium]
MDFKKYLQEHIVYLDGGMGTLLQARGLGAGEKPERWNITHAQEVIDIHTAYFNAGSNVVCTNTFGANGLKFDDAELEEIVKAAVKNAQAAKASSVSNAEKFVALDIGPTGKLLKPLGDLDFEDAVAAFAKTVKLGAEYGVDCILVETMSDCYETKAAILAAKENCDLPVIVCNAYGEDGKLMTGATPAAMVALAEGMGAAAIGANCSLGPKQLRGVVEELLQYASIPVVLKPNAGLPKAVDGKTVYDISTSEFAKEVAALVKKGVRMIGGCCGTTPEYIQALKEETRDITPMPLTDKGLSLVSSYTHAVAFGAAPVLIGERINPTGKKRFKQALRDGDIPYILNEGVTQAEKGVHILDVNVGLPEIDEKTMLKTAVCELQAVTDLPLQVDTADPVAMERAMRYYNGKVMVNSVNGKQESMDAVFPLVKKYGGVVVALTLDDNGIPTDADGRVRIAKNILATAKKYGIDKKDIVFDPLAMAISADDKAAMSTLTALKRIKTELGCHTSLGVSNVSFGLPNRDAVNAAFFALALGSGLSAAIMNPYSADMLKTYYAYKALNGMDENCADYIRFAPSLVVETSATTVVAAKSEESYKSDLQRAIVKGFSKQAGEITQALLLTVAPLDIVNGEIIPALDIVGAGFEKKTVYLPQLLMSAEAAKAAFERVKAASAGDRNANKGTFVLATVKGDIHDIGKNIVKLLLENYGFAVVDLGKDVAAETVVNAVEETHAPLVGLSALMTTTVPAMDETVKLLRMRAPWCKVVVGGAVLTQEYADAMGADKYAKDAMETVRFAEETIR